MRVMCLTMVMTNNRTKDLMVESNRKYILFLLIKKIYNIEADLSNETKTKTKILPFEIFGSFSMSLPSYCLAKTPVEAASFYFPERCGNKINECRNMMTSKHQALLPTDRTMPYGMFKNKHDKLCHA